YRPSVLLPDARASVATLKGRENDEPSRGLGHGATQLERATAKLVRVLARQVIAEIRAAWCLTPAEARTVTALAAGRSTAEIAAAHDVSVHTVRTQLKRAMSKARVHTQSALVASVYSFVLARQRPRTRFGAALWGHYPKVPRIDVMPTAEQEHSSCPPRPPVCVLKIACRNQPRQVGESYRTAAATARVRSGAAGRSSRRRA